MRTLLALSVLALSLLVPATAGAGGWASIGFAPLPDGTSAGATWEPRITVKQHGVTPLAGLHPLVTISDARSGARETFAATPAGEPGVYEAEVVFPTAGSWHVEIDSTFGESRLTYGPTAIGSPPAGSGSPTFPTAAVLGAFGLFAVAAAAGVLATRRLRRLEPVGR